MVLRLGAVYGRGILMVEAARWLAKRRLLCVWRKPTLFHLLSTADFLRATEAAIFKSGVRGIYHIGDEQPVTAQEFLDAACRVWGYPAPRRLPFWMIYAAACVCEGVALWRARHRRLRETSCGSDACRIGVTRAARAKS